MPQQTISIQRGNDQLPLCANLSQPLSKARAYALFIHCFSALNSNAHHSIIDELVASGIGVLSFDCVGKNIDATKQSIKIQPMQATDIQLACEYLNQHYFTPQIFIGHSLASLALFPAVNQFSERRAVISIATPTTTDFNHQSASQDLFNKGTTHLDLESTSVSIGSWLLEQTQRNSIDELLTTNTPLLLLHGSHDTIFDYQKLHQLASTTPSSVIRIEEGDHQLSSFQASQFTATMIAQWSNSQLTTGIKTGIQSFFNDKKPSHEHNTVTVAESHKSPYQNDAYLGGHHIYTDRSLTKGGRNSGPAPTPLLLAALGTSASIAMRDYAQHKKWSLEHICTHLRLVTNTHSADASIPSGQHIILEIILDGSLDNVQRSTLAEVASECLIERYLEIKVITRLHTDSA